MRGDNSARDVAAEPTICQVLHPAAGLATSVEVRHGRAIYEVRTGDPLYRQRLEHMGFPPASADRFVRRLSATGDVLRTHANFARHLQEMLLQSARRRPVPWWQALEVFLERVEGSQLRWFLYGSGALAVRGIDVGPGDLDFCVDDSQLAGTLFEDLLVEPVTAMTGWIADSGGRAFSGCLFEWMAGVHADIDEPEPHEQGPAAAARLEHVRWHGHDVPVAPLDLQLAVNQRRGLTSRIQKIHAYLSPG
ncbi:hypothetical protein [Streptomyces griseofuscus]|uniref:hypothetical protein n=1 Tax=Streptomyces griseofuscus TaxID=146922 RepID=UPI00345283BE